MRRSGPASPAPDNGSPEKASDAGNARGEIADAGVDATVPPMTGRDASTLPADSGPAALTEDGAAPGEVTVQTGSALQVSAFLDPTTRRAVVAINGTVAAVSLPLYIDAHLVPGTITPWVTSSGADLAAQAPLTVNEGRFTSTLAAQSVTTFVSGP